MATTPIDDATPFEDDPFTSEWAWRAGALASVVAAVAMGIAMMVTRPTVLRESIPGLYGQQGSLLVGWLAHLVHGALYGMLFALALADPALYHLSNWRWKTLLAGVVYGLVLAVVGTGLVLPMWLEALGFPSPPSLPFVTVNTILWHVVFGAVLGGLFPFAEDV